MKYAVEVAHLLNGELISVRRLSSGRERAGAILALGVVAGCFLLGMAVAMTVARVTGRVFYAPHFLALWLGLGTLVAGLAWVRVSRRLGRYTLGTRLDADGFAPFEVDLVRRVGGRSGSGETEGTADDFELTLVPGMQGIIESGRAPLPLEAMVGARPRTIPLDRNVRAEVRLGASTFVVRSVELGAGSRAEVPRDFWRLFSRVALGGLELATLGTFLAVLPRAETIGERALRAQGPRITTPWEAEKRLRLEAQEQAASLHQCFDPLPISCQRSGYVGVGVSLNRDGELRSNWIARSTYGRECPVDQCMKDVVSTWLFDPLPEAMRVVLPVQVLRTEKPLPPKVVQAEAMWGGDLAVEWARGGR